MALDISSVQINSSIQYEASKRSSAHAVEGKAAPKVVESVPADLKTMIRDLQRFGGSFNRRLSFSVNEKLRTVIVKVIDNDTDKVVREIPTAELQRCYERIREMLGLLFDKSA